MLSARTYTIQNNPAALKITKDGKYDVIDYQDQLNLSSLSPEAGAPDLPIYLYRIQLPPKTTLFSFSVVSTKEQRLDGNYLPRPRQPLWSQESSDKKIKADLKLYGQAQVPLRFLGVKYFNGRAIAHFAVSPVRYEQSTQTLYFIKRMELSIQTAAQSNDIVHPFLQQDGQNNLRLFSNNIKATVQSAGPVAPIDLSAEVLSSGIIDRYVIVTTEALKDALQPLADWKIRRGVPTVIRTVSWIRQNFPQGVDEAETIRNFLRWTYQKRGTKYVLLAGDTGQVPTRIITTGGFTFGTDYYYAGLDGNWNANENAVFGEAKSADHASDNVDGYAELYVSRIPVHNSEEVQRFIKKLFKYEKLNTIDPYEAYPANVLYSGANLSRVNDGRDLIMKNIDPMINPSFTRRLITQSGEIGSSPQIPWEELNSDYGIIFTESHGTYNRIRPGAKGSYIYSYQLDNLTNSQPAIWYIASCYTNAISRRTFSEVYMNSKNGGGVAYIGNSSFEYPFSGITLEKKFFDLAFNLNRFHLSEAHFLSRYPFLGYLNWEGPSRIIVFSTVVLGDAEMPIWTSKPQPLNVTHRFALIGDSRYLNVTVENADTHNPLKDAVVTFYKKGKIYRIKYTDPLGQVQFAANNIPADSVYLTVSKHNYKPSEELLRHLNSENVKQLSLSAFDIKDLSGTLLSFCETGQQTHLYLSLKNSGSEELPSTVQVQLQSLNPDVKLGRHSLALTSSLPAQSGVQLGPWPMNISAKFPTDTTVLVKAVFKDGNYPIGQADITFPVYLPHLNLGQVWSDTSVKDSVGSNNVFIRLINNGKGRAEDVRVQLTAIDSTVAVFYGNQTYGTIAGGAATVNQQPFLIRHNQPLATLSFQVLVTWGRSYQRIFKVNFKQPQAPQHLAFEPVNGQSVALTWRVSNSADVLGYEILRREKGGTSFEPVNDEPVLNSGYFIDDQLKADHTYEYTIQTVDSSGNRSISGDTISAWPTLPYQTNFPAYLENKAIGAENNGVLSYDLDGDGRCEIIASGGWGILNIYNAQGELLSQTDLGEGKLLQPAAGNVIGNADPEIVVSSSVEGALGNSVSVLDAAGNLLYSQTLGYNAPTAALLKDLDHDGLAEVMVLTHSCNAPQPPKDSRLFIWKITPAGFESFPGWPAEGYIFNDAVCLGMPAAADMNHSDKVSVVVSTYRSKLYLFNPTDSSRAVWVKNLTGYLNAPVSLADVNKDGSLDIVIAAIHADKLYVLDRNGDPLPGWEDGKSVEVTDPWGHASPAIIGNLDDDPYLEIVYVGRQHVYVFKQDGSLLDGWPVAVDNGNSFYVTHELMSPSNMPVLADLNQDGHQEIVFLTAFGMLHAFDATGKDIYGFPINTHNDQVQGQSPLVDDIDRDGDLEALLIDQEGILRVWDAPYSYSGSTTLSWNQPFANAAHTGELDTIKLEAISAIGHKNRLPKSFSLEQNYPNPFNPSTTVRWQLAENSRVELSIYNILGQKIRKLFSGRQAAGRHSINWDGRNASGQRMASGIYIYRLNVCSQSGAALYSNSKKMLLVK